MWPGSASGFEPTNWSPAGRAQLGWRFLQNLTRPGRRLRVPTLVFVWAALALVLWGLFGVLVQILL